MLSCDDNAEVACSEDAIVEDARSRDCGVTLTTTESTSVAGPEIVKSNSLETGRSSLAHMTVASSYQRRLQTSPAVRLPSFTGTRRT